MICDFSSELSSFIIRYLFSLLLRLYILREWQHVVPLRILAELQQWYQQRQHLTYDFSAKINFSFKWNFCIIVRNTIQPFNF